MQPKPEVLDVDRPIRAL